MYVTCDVDANGKMFQNETSEIKTDTFFYAILLQQRTPIKDRWVTDHSILSICQIL